MYLMHEIKGKVGQIYSLEIKIPHFIPCIRNLIKFCFQVTYNEVVKNETHRHCYEPLVRQCNGEPANNREVCKVWQYRLWNFQERDTKLERRLAKNEHTAGIGVVGK